MDGIVEVDGDHEKGTATVTYRRDKVSVERIVDRINEKTSFKASLPEKKTEKPDDTTVGRDISRKPPG